MSLDRQPSFRYERPTVNPFVPAGTTNIEISGPRSPSPVTAATVQKPVIGVPELVM